jgi:hypothetical protein
LVPFQGGGEGGGVGWKALQQQLALGATAVAEGIEGIGAGRCQGKPLQQLPPEPLGGGAIAQFLLGLGLLL